MGFDAATLASEDVPDVDSLHPTAKKILTVANVTTKDGKTLGAPVLYKTLKTAAGRKVRVAIIGLLGNPPYGSVPNPLNSPADLPWHVGDPGAALKALLPEARKKADLVVVMYAGTRQPGKAMVDAVPGVDVLIVGAEGSVDQQAEKDGATLIVQNAERGRYAASLGLTLDAKNHITASDLKTAPVDAAFADDAAMAELVKQYHNRVAASAPPSIFDVSSTKTIWAGSYVCGSCHAAEFQQWKETQHFRAMLTLENKDGGTPAKRPDCVPCHVVAFDKPGGYSIAQPRWDLKGVGCEACHGPAAAHVEARLRQQPDASHMIKTPTKAQCVTCHNQDNSPNFNFDVALLHVMHHPPVAAKAGTR